MKIREMKFWRDVRGVSAIEFALIAPVIIFLYLGLAEFSQGYMAQKRVSHVAAMIADLTARRQAVKGTELDDILSIGTLLMRPFPTETLTRRVASVTRVSATQLRIDWQRGNMGELTLTGLTIPAGLIEDGQTLIIADAAYDYDSPVDYVLDEATRFEHRTYLRPREIDLIPCECNK